mgnify:CR=1 FL=1
MNKARIRFGCFDYFRVENLFIGNFNLTLRYGLRTQLNFHYHTIYEL